MKKVKKIFFNNLGLKIGALVIASVMWFVITNTSDPETQSQYTGIPVRFSNMDTITENGKVLTVLDDSDTVTIVTVRAPRSVVDQLSSDNILATADVRNLKEDGTIPITYSTNRYSSQIESIKGSSESITVSVENSMSKSLQVKAFTVGDPETGYTVGDVTLEQNQIRISGPESIVSTIVRAEASVDVSGATSSITTNVEIRLLDEDGNDVDETGLTLNITSVKITASILPVKEIPVYVSVGGTPADGYALNGAVTVEPAEIMIAGKNSALSAVDSVIIPSDAADVTGADQNVTFKIELSDYLPDNIKIAESDFDGYVYVTVGVEALASKNLTVSIPDVQLNNVPDGYTAAIVTMSDSEGNVATQSNPTELTLTVRGLQEELDAISSEDFQFMIDAESLLAVPADSGNTISGLYTVDVTIQAPDGITVDSGLRAAVRISDNTDEEVQ